MVANVLQITSRAGVVYTGQLHSIDTKHLTVTLKKVQILNETDMNQLTKPGILKFDYVIFRGSDIEDVKLCISLGDDILAAEDYAIVHLDGKTEKQLINYFQPAKTESRKIVEEDVSLQDPAIVKICRVNENAVMTKCQLPSNKVERKESRKATRSACDEAVLPPTSSGDNDISSSDSGHAAKEKTPSVVCLEGASTKSKSRKIRRIRSSDAVRCSIVSLSPMIKRSISWNFQKSLKDDTEKTDESTGPRGDTEESLWSENGDKREVSSITVAYDRQRSFFDDFTTGPHSSRNSHKVSSTSRAGAVNLNSTMNRDQEARYPRKAVGVSSFPHSSYPSFTIQSAHCMPYETAFTPQGEWLLYPQYSPSSRIPLDYQESLPESMHRMYPHIFGRVYYSGV
ncbi:hypothetical protein D915_007163 [Fasciola hepatica]|uniref:Lsm14-like N-terminal domain-containing protein n=1 Tax=Fasciola hepatica TaxID=6192 RepID=A0A4E0R4P6_FASHE|nr:hypothetical protein D915_007163 [Fasciola hepatica]